MKPNDEEIGIGATQELSLRVSVASLVSVLFIGPEDGRTMVALERVATLRRIERRSEITVRAKPIGGAVRLIDPQALKRLIGPFHYDSERSRRERDFRIQIDPGAWEKLRETCRGDWEEREKCILDPTPERELAEEFEDTLDVKITPNQYRLKPRGTIVEDLPSETDNVRAEGVPTVRIYYLFEAWMDTPEIVALMLANDRRYSDRDLQQMAWKDAQRGGSGRANAILTLGLDDLKDVYRSIPTGGRGGLVRIGGHQLDGNVLAILEQIVQPKYQRYIRQPH